VITLAYWHDIRSSRGSVIKVTQ